MVASSAESFRACLPAKANGKSLNKSLPMVYFYSNKLFALELNSQYNHGAPGSPLGAPKKTRWSLRASRASTTDKLCDYSHGHETSSSHKKVARSCGTSAVTDSRGKQCRV